MGDFKEADPDREKKRQKALRRMGKILSKAWELPQSECFQSSKHSNATLAIIGEKIDEEGYKYGRHGWEDFAKDIGAVYNRHIHRYVDSWCESEMPIDCLSASGDSIECSKDT